MCNTPLPLVIFAVTIFITDAAICEYLPYCKIAMNTQDTASLFKQCDLKVGRCYLCRRSIFKSMLATLNRTTRKARKIEILEQIFFFVGI